MQDRSRMEQIRLEANLRKSALDYHETDPPGKIAIQATKPVANQRDLALAYSPGVAHACMAIVDDPAMVSRLTARGNLVGVISNGTAVLGLGDIGPLASKPVMEGKAVLFKKFAGIDVYDIEIAEKEVDAFVEAVARLEPTFGGINLEDIKSPECFEIERRLKERMRIPVFHDDQHGTAIVVAAGILNGLKLVGKHIGDVRLVCSGAGAAALACLNLLVALGLRRENVFVADIKGCIYIGRTELMDAYKEPFAQATKARALAELMPGADVFLGLSAGRIVTREMVAEMAPRPLVFALANPVPEIMPEDVKEVRPDAITASGRTDYPNQINNVLCFPFIFRGALDVGATTINEEMKKAAVIALAGIAEGEASDIVLSAYRAETFVFGPDYIIPKPFDPRLITEIAPAVAKAAMDSGVATRPITDFRAYKEKLSSFIYRSGFVMRPMFEAAKVEHRRQAKRIVYAEGEHPYVLQAAQQVIAEGIARPVLVGRRDSILRTLPHLGLRMRPDEDFDIFDQESDHRVAAMTEEYHRLVERRGISPSHARRIVRAGSTVIAGLLLRRGDADAMICGAVGRYQTQLRHVSQVIGKRSSVRGLAALSGIILPTGPLFLADTYVNYDPDPERLAEITLLAAEEVRRFGIEPKVALLSHSSFGTEDTVSARKMRDVLAVLADRSPGLEVEGEMHADAALSPFIREEIFPNSSLVGPANLLIMPCLDAANIAFNLLKVVSGAVVLGPMLLGAARAVHIVTPSVTVRGLLNMSAIAICDAFAGGEVAER
ncbi:MAG: NADP-dependent malic enzyme [Hyphomicrobiaceae bacterium]|nr:NADP-dependent malic enzyme [Hyphomicrobiaceae bacterium]